MSRFDRFDYGDEVDSDRRQDDGDTKSKKFDRHAKESRKGDYLQDDDYSRKSLKKFVNADSKMGSYSYTKSQDRYSVSTDSEAYEDVEYSNVEDKKPKKCKDNRSAQVKAPLIRNKPRTELQGDDSNSGEEDLSSARALTLKTKLILSKLGWNASSIPEKENKTTNNGDERSDKIKNKKFSDDSSPRKIPYDHKHEVSEERRVQTGEFSKAKFFGGCRDEKDVKRTRSKTPHGTFSDFEDEYNVEARMKNSINSKVEDDDLIALNIKECRSAIDSARMECEEIRNVKVQPKLEKSKIKKRQYSDDVERVPSELEDVRIVEPKRFKKSPRYQEDEINHWKDDKSGFKSGERRRVTMKEMSHSRMRRNRSRSVSSFSEDSYSSYERRRSKHKKKYKIKDSFSWKDKQKALEDRGRHHGENFRNSKSFDKWSSKHRGKSQSFEPREKLEDKSKLEVQVVKEEKQKKMSIQCDYFDEGSHWCERCNVIYEEAVDYLKHLHSDSHQKSVRKDPKPWEDKSDEGARVRSSRNKISLPLKGLEFMIGTSAFYCKLCSELIADVKLAEKHVKSESHNGNYRDFLQKNPKYAKLRTMDVESRVFQAVRVTHQEEFPEDYDLLPAMPKNKVKEEPLVEVSSMEESVMPKIEDGLEDKVEPQEAANTTVEEPISERVVLGSQQPEESEERPVMHEDSWREESVRQEPIVMELRSKHDKASLGLRSANSVQNATVAKEVVNAASMSSLKKLPFIGKRPSKISFKNEGESGKPQTAHTNSASLSREELLSRVMKDTVIIQPKDIRITPFPGIPPDGMVGGYMGGYMPMMAPYMSYPQYGGYYDMNMYYDPSFYATATPDVADTSTSQTNNEQQASNAESAVDMDLECAVINQDHYENYTIGCDSAPFDSSMNIEDVENSKIENNAEPSGIASDNDRVQNKPNLSQSGDFQADPNVCESTCENAEVAIQDIA